MEMEKHQLTMQVDPDLPPVKADAAALTQCLQNLLSNAFKYGRHGDDALIEIFANKDARAREVQLRVCDGGPGIDRIDQRHLFEPFYRGVRVGSNVPGNGLGLHLVQRMMQSQGGGVTFSPSPKGGACFTLHIPASE
jgi:signal transduction histidine kinase